VEIQQGRSRKHPGKNGAFEESCEHRAGDGPLVGDLATKIVTRILMSSSKLSQAIQASVDTLHISNQAIKDDSAFVRDTIPTLQEGLVAVRDVQSLQWDAQKLQQHYTVMDWLSPTDFPAQQHDVITRRQEGTGQWFLNSPEFTDWLQGSGKTLFCPGIPGAGKTMIAAIAVDHLGNLARSKNIGVAYIFCNYKSQADQSVNTLLAAILKQLVQTQPVMAEQVIRLYDSHSVKRTRPSLDEIFTALQSACKYSRVYIVVDALDECTDQEGARSRLLAKLRKLQHGSNICLMVTSRFIPDIEQEFRSALKLEVRASDEDVRRYVAGQIPYLPKCIQRDDEMKSLVQGKIVKAVDGMYVLSYL